MKLSDFVHIVSQDTWTIGVSWLNEELYGEGGLEIHIGKRIICFWAQPRCPYCFDEGDGWPEQHDTWTCPSCKRNYSK